MELVWTNEIKDKDFIYYNYNCKPFIWNNKLFYAYRTIDKDNILTERFYGTKISVIEKNLADLTSIKREICFKHKEPAGKKILQSSNWEFQIIEDKIHLNIGFILELNGVGISISSIDSKLVEWRVRSDYYFADKYLKYNQLSTIECFDNVTNKQVWKIKIKGYLYTNIEQKDNCLTFGTAGKGGAFYCVRLADGHILTEYSNSDSSNFVWQNNSIILRDIKGNLQQINPFTSQLINELKLTDKLFFAPILVDNGYIYSTVYNKKKNIGKIICVKNE